MSAILSAIKQRQVFNLDELDAFQPYKDDKLRKWDIDPLILAVSLKDLADRTGRVWSLESKEVRDNVNDVIVAKSEVIRKYYTKKFFWKNLSGTRELSPFRQRVCYLLETRTLETKDRDCGIYFKLPWFYDEDMIYDEFKRDLKTTNLPDLNLKSQPVAKRLSYIKSTLGWQAKKRVKYLWFKDDDNYLHGLVIDNDNPLLETFYDIILEKESCTFIAHINQDRIDNLHFYKLFKFKLIKE